MDWLITTSNCSYVIKIWEETKPSREKNSTIALGKRRCSRSRRNSTFPVEDWPRSASATTSRCRPAATGPRRRTENRRRWSRSRIPAAARPMRSSSHTPKLRLRSPNQSHRNRQNSSRPVYSRLVCRKRAGQSIIEIELTSRYDHAGFYRGCIALAVSKFSKCHWSRPAARNSAGSDSRTMRSLPSLDVKSAFSAIR